MPKKKTKIASLFRSKKKDIVDKIEKRDIQDSENSTPTNPVENDQAYVSYTDHAQASVSAEFPPSTGCHKEKKESALVKIGKITEKITHIPTEVYDTIHSKAEFFNDKTNPQQKITKSGTASKSTCKGNVEKNKYAGANWRDQTHDSTSEFKRPEFGAKYSSYLDKNATTEFDKATGYFKPQIDLSSCYKSKSKDWFSIQMQAHKAQPCVAFGNLGFYFDDNATIDTINTLSSKATKYLTEDLFRFISVKLESIKAIYYALTGKMVKAKEIMEKLETKVHSTEHCDITAWFHVATLWYLIQSYQESDRSDWKRYKYEMVSCLTKARKGFQADDSFFAWEAAMVQWWLFLVTAGLLEHALYIPSTRRQLSLSNEETEMARQHLNDFQTESNALNLFPKDNPQYLELLRIFETQCSSEEPLDCDQDDKSRDFSHESVEKERAQVVSGLYLQFVKSMRRNLPDFIQRVMKSETDNKIYVYTTDKESREYRKFLRDIDFTKNKSFYEIVKLDTPIMPVGRDKSRDSNVHKFANCEGNCEILAHEQIKPGGVVFSVPKKKKKSLPKYLDQLMQPSERPCTWTMGFLAKDKDSKRKGVYIITCAHCVPKENRIGKDLAFYSAYEQKKKKNPNQIDKVIDEINTSRHHGFYGGYDIAGEDIPQIVDILTLKIDEKYLKRPKVDMVIRKSSVPLEMEIFDGDMNELLDMKVSMRACMSNFLDDIGTIVDPNVGGLNVYGVMCDGAIAIKLNEQFFAQHKRRIAQEGDSGGLIFGYHEGKKKYIAIGLIWGKNAGSHKVSKNGETYNEVTYCSPLKLALKYLSDNGLDIKYHVPESVSLPQEATQRTTQRGTMQVGGPSQRGTIQGGTTQRGTMQGGTTQRGTIQGGTTQRGTMQVGGPSQRGTIQGGTTQRGTMQGGTTQRGTMQERGPSQRGTMQEGSKSNKEYHNHSKRDQTKFHEKSDTNENSELVNQTKSDDANVSDTTKDESTTTKQSKPARDKRSSQQVGFSLPVTTEPAELHANGVPMRSKSLSVTKSGYRSQRAKRHSTHSCTHEENKKLTVVERIQEKIAEKQVKAIIRLSLSLNSYFDETGYNSLETHSLSMTHI